VLAASQHRPANAIPSQAKPPAPNRIDELLSQLKELAQGDRPDPRAAQHYLSELDTEMDNSGAALSALQSKQLIALTLDRRIFGEAIGGGGGVLASVKNAADLFANSQKESMDQSAIDSAIAQVHNDLADAQRHVPNEPMVALLKTLQDNRQFAHLSQLSDRLLTRDARHFDSLAIPYAQGLIDGGHLLAAIDFLTAAVAGNQLTPKKKAVAHGLLGRAHKQIYMNFVRSPRDALALSDTMAPRLQQAVQCYAVSFDKDRAGETSYHGINVVALCKRAERDSITLTDVPDADDAARRIIKDLEAKVTSSPQAWDLATLAEAYLAVGDLENSAKYYGRYAKHEGLKPFQLLGTIRQLEQVWGLSADVTGEGAILTGLKSVLVANPEATPTMLIRPAEQRVLANARHANAQSVQYSQHFETMTPDGKQSQFEIIFRLARGGTAVAAVQIPKDGGGWTTHGTAFLVPGAQLSPQLDSKRSYMLTNAHVIWDKDQKGESGTPESSGKSAPWDKVRIVFEVDEIEGRRDYYTCARVVWQSSSSRYDAVLFELDQPVPQTRTQPLELAGNDFRPVVEAKNIRGTKLFVIGHAGGRPMTIGYEGSLEESGAVLVDVGRREHESKDGPTYYHYRLPTEGGNSGSPVFTVDGWKVVALHHAGFPAQRLNGASGTIQANEGICIASIRAAITADLEPKPVAAEPVKSKWRLRKGTS
jgi:Trypsin-like peptidase domain